jgi:hypothetical protein
MSNLKDKMPPSNISTEEFFKYYCKDDNAILFYEQARDSQDNAERRIKPLENENECIREQLNFALDAIRDMEIMLDRVTRLTEYKKEFIRILDDSYLER